MAGTQKGSSVQISGISASFHTYKLVWTPTSIRVSVEGDQMFEYLKEANADYSSWPLDNDFNIVLDAAVGGSWSGAQSVDSTVFPQTFFIDYVRLTP
jgi:beta-glucanase (GH16 family)